MGILESAKRFALEATVFADAYNAIVDAMIYDAVHPPRPRYTATEFEFEFSVVDQPQETP